MARKDQLSSKKDGCDICGAELDDDAVIQEFPDGSVVRLCAECATAAPPEEEFEDQLEPEPGDPTEEWAGPDEHHSPADSPRFRAEDFDPDDDQPNRPVAADVADSGDDEDGPSKAAAELAAWASAPSPEQEIDDEDAELGGDFDEQEAHQAALELMAAIQEADMAEDATGEQEAVPGVQGGYGAETEAEPEVEAYEEDEEAPEYAAAYEEDEEAGLVAAEGEAADAEIADKTKELLVPVTDLLSLQTEMQSALSRLSSTLEHFVSDMVASEEKTSAINDRLQQLEDELESTRERLRATEALLPESSFDAVAAVAAATAASDHELIGTQPALDQLDTDMGAPIPPPVPAAERGRTGKRKAVATAAPVSPPPILPPPILPPPILPPALGVVPPSLPPLPGMPKVVVPALVPPPIGAHASPLAFGAAPPPLPPMSTPKPAPRPAMSLEDDLDLDYEAPDFNPSPVTQKAAPAPRPATAPRPAAPKAPAPRPVVPGAADATAVDADFLPPIPGPTPTPLSHSVAGAAAAMSKLLRGRKGHHLPEPEPEPQSEPEPEEEAGLTFSINEVQVAQRFFNESEYTSKIAEISKSIGKPKVNVSRSLPGAPEAAITVFWDIVWYQYLVDLRKDPPSGQERVVLDREGMDLEELEPRFREKNGTINDDGRLDASELEVRLLSDPSALITEMEIPMPSPESRLADDATEEIWDQRSAPDFRWD